MKKYILLFIILFSIHNTYSQNKLINQAEKDYDQYAFVSASELYNKLIEKKYGSPALYSKLGEAYFLNGEYGNALKAYDQMYKTKDNFVIPNIQLLRYAQTLKSNGQYDDAAKIIRIYNARSGNTSISASTDYLQDLLNNSNPFTIKPVSINSQVSDYGPAFYKDNKVIFTSARDTNVVKKYIDKWNGKPFFKLYEATMTDDGDLTDAKKISGKINSVYHQSTPVITKDGNQIYFTRSNYLGGKFGKDDTNTNRLKIYRATLHNGNWTNIEDLSINDKSFSNAHPALSADGKTLIFASDRPGTLGQTDLYEVEIKQDGTFGEPRNLGPSINTAGRETFPFVSKTGEFYFASDGHPGLGGLDVFEGIKQKDNSYKVVNVGQPINTTEDDFGYIVNPYTHKGFFASNRTSKDQIYSFTELRNTIKYEILVYGKVYDKKHSELLPKVKITVYDKNQNKLDDFYTDNAGEYLLKVPVGDYYLTYDKTGYYQEKQDLHIAEEQRNQTIEINKYLISDPNANSLISEDNKTITDNGDLTKQLDLKPIYFDFDGDKIKPISEIELNKVLQVLKDYPNISVDIRSHTDSRGNADYNLKLSDRRAKSTVKYLLSKGVRADRITGKGYGESQLINKCADGVKCSEEEHQLNRRSEFIINFNK
ncbi:OmpA family protein [Flavobacterium sp. KJJ]|uniref:OmpA family protein n=1 Tax=Flavobacterium sp. KJJ TaxID=1270193 RepID=UPI0004935AA5|nr:OmpA family protein [Flavobacterium sp. KJJ]